MFLFVALLGAADAIAAPSWSGDSRGDLRVDHDEAAAKFSAFIQRHRRAYEVGSDEYEARFAHFKERLAAIAAHNGRQDCLWSAKVNMLADRAPEELAMLRGYRRSSAKRGSPASFLGLASVSVSTDLSGLPKNFTWKGQLKAMQDVRYQGSCGSCWAMSSATVLRAHAELYQHDRTFSIQQLVDCTPNPLSCGGTGGCSGATAELAMIYATKVGLATEEEHAYAESDGACPPQMQAAAEPAAPQALLQGQVGAASGPTGWRRLPENMPEPLLLAVYEKGPAVVSVAATDAWNMYDGGIMADCERGAVVNHAVVLIGFGEEDGSRFWQIQNSWGNSWGEEGFIRLLRRERHEEGAYCGWDSNPADGTGCTGGPSKVYVCGSCGILYDSVLPTFALSKDGFFSRQKRSDFGIFTEVNTTVAARLRH